MTNFEDYKRYSGPSFLEFEVIEHFEEQTLYWQEQLADHMADGLFADEIELDFYVSQYRKIRDALRRVKAIQDHLLDTGQWAGCIVKGQL